jgi:hypothetical protein
MKQYFVYILLCNDNSYYTGMTWKEECMSMNMESPQDHILVLADQ